MIYINGIASGASTFIGGVPAGGRDVVRETTSSVHVYADGTSGNDLNDGLSMSTPKKTLQAAIGVFPHRILHDSTLHLSGIFLDQGHIYIRNEIAGGVKLLIDGGEDLIIVDDNSGSNYTLTSSSTSAWTVASAGWTADVFRGYLAEVVTGPSAGTIRTIQGNNSDTLDPQKTDVDPGLNQIRISKPATTISASSVDSFIKCTTVGGGELKFQRFCIDGSKVQFNLRNSTTQISLAGIVSDSEYVNPLDSRQCTFLRTSTIITDPLTYNNADSSIWSGVSFRKEKKLIIQDGELFISSIISSKLRFENVAYYFLASAGSRFFGRVELQHVYERNEGYSIASTPGYQTTKFSNSSGDGIQISFNSYVSLGDVDISNCGLHGISVRNSYVNFSGVTTGTGNTKAGMYASQGSTIILDSGVVPTITGASGTRELAVSNPDAQESTWANISSSPVNVLSEMTMCKEV